MTVSLAVLNFLLAVFGLFLAVGVVAGIAAASWNGGVSRGPLPRTRPTYRRPYGGVYA